MKQKATDVEGLEPLDDLDSAGMLAASPKTMPGAVRVNFRGRSILMRGLRRPPKGIWRWLLVLGPGLIATSAGNDAGGIATYSSAGAKFGYDLIWVMIVLTLSFAVVQETCSRLGAATGCGLLDLIRERFGIGWTLFAVGIIIIANGGVTVTEFVGVGAASELLGVSRYIAVPIAAVGLWYLVIFGSYAHVEKLFLLMTLVFLRTRLPRSWEIPIGARLHAELSFRPCVLNPNIFSCSSRFSAPRLRLIFRYFSKARRSNAERPANITEANGSMRTSDRSFPI